MTPRDHQEALQDGTRGRREGFSLVEVVISLTILGVLFAAAFGALHQGLLINGNANKQNLANELISRETEFIRTLDWAEISSLDEEGPFAHVPDDDRVTTLRVIEVAHPGMAFVKLSVSWTDGRGKTHTVAHSAQ